jgi:uncharacterized protein (DUF58 family)
VSRARTDGAVAVLDRRGLYMLPTRHGLLFAIFLFVLLLAGINYENGLVYALTFWLASMAMVSMLYTHRNVAGLRIAVAGAAPVFAGEPARFTISLQNDTAGPRRHLVVAQKKREFGWVDIAPFGQGLIEIETPTSRRGYVAVPEFSVSSQQPLGLLFTWSRKIRLGSKLLVYPAPGPRRPIVGAADQERRRESGHRAEGDDFIGVRAFQHGDSPRQVDWKAVARGQGMQTKRFGGGSCSLVWLDWDSLEGLDTEARLSQLTRWILDADGAGWIYGLRLPGTSIAPSGGEAHRHRCLEALALFQG